MFHPKVLRGPYLMKGLSVRIFLQRLAPDLFSRVFQTLDLFGQLHLGLLQLVLEFLKFYVSCRYKTFYRL